MFKTTVRILNWSRKYSTRIKKGFILSFLNSVFIAMPIMLSIYVFNLVSWKLLWEYNIWK